MAKTTAINTDALEVARDRAARKAEIARTRLNRDRAKMLDNVKTCITQASLSIAAGDVAKHDKWLSATTAALNSYAEFAALTVDSPAGDDADSNANAV